MKQIMKNRKAVAVVLLLAMLFSIMPTAAWADESDETTAYVTVVNQGELVMAHKAVTVTTGSAIIDDFLREAHANYYTGDTDGYASAEGDYGLSITELWGDTSGAYGYYVNDASAWSLADPVNDGDHVVAFIYSDQIYWGDQYSFFDTHKVVTENGLELILEVSVSGYDAEWNPVQVPMVDAVITIDGAETDFRTDENGRAIISLPELTEYDENWNLKSESHIVSATAPEGYVIVPPVCEVLVKPYLTAEDIAGNQEADYAQHVSAAWAAIQSNSPFIVEQGDNFYQIIEDLVKDDVVTVAFAPVENVLDASGNILVNENQGSVNVSVTVSCGTISKTESVPVLVNGVMANSEALLYNIASSYVNTGNKWNVMDMGNYSRLYNTDVNLTETAKQNYINTVITSIQNGSYSESGYTTEVILPLTAMGVDASRLYPANSTKTINAFAKLNEVEPYISEWVTPYTLIAYNHGYGTGTNETSLLDGLLALQKEDGGWGSVDPTGESLAALAFYNGDSKVDTAIDKAVDYLEAQMRADGVYEDGWNGYNANSTAMAVIGLAAVYDTLDDAEKAVFEQSVEGLLSFAVNDNSGFWKAPDVTLANAKATEQGFRALIAASQVMKTGNAFNVYDFSGNELVPGRATGSGQVSKPSAPSGSQNITVTVSIKGLDGYWLKDKNVTLKDDATMYWALTEAIKDTAITQTGAENGYVSEMSNGSISLEEFDYGRNSGWLYKVNEKLPEVGILEYNVKNGDKIVWYYTKNWTQDSLAGARVDNTDKQAAAAVDELIGKIGELDKITKESEAAIRAAREAYDALTDKQKALVDKYDDLTAAEAYLEELLAGEGELPFRDTENHWAKDAIGFVYDRGLLRGVSDGQFAPDADFSRAMLVTVLHRMAGSPAANGANPFYDVRDTAWYANPVSWAYQNKLAGGMDADSYAPENPITREQLAVMLMRYAQYCGYDTSDTIRLVHYKDADSVSSYAETAVKWAVSTGLIKGRTANELKPQGTATRAEVAVMLQRFCQMYEIQE